MSQHPFRFGVINEQPCPEQGWLNQVRRVEAAGYATFLIRDHLIPDVFGDQFAPLLALAAAVAATTTLRVGTLVLDNDFRHPALLAKEGATLDLLSGGRLELGLGAGWLRNEYAAAGIPFEPAGTRIERLGESLAVIKGLWQQGPLNFGGRHYTIAGLDGFPKPQQHLPPLLLGGGQRRMLTLAGQQADIVSILTTSVASGALVDDGAERSPAAVEQKLAWVRAGAGERFANIELNIIPTLIVTDQRRQQTEQLIQNRGWQGVTLEDVWAMPSMLIGSLPQIAADMLERRDRYGFSYYVVADNQVDLFAPLVGQLAGL